jgi:hypothetical protein
MGIGGVLEGVAGNALWKWLTSACDLFGNRIVISSPRPNESLIGTPASAGLKSYSVFGTLKRLPKDHAVWLLVEGDTTTSVWPQGHEQVVHDSASKVWRGKITARQGIVRIYAVVAPLTSQDFFRYYEQSGQKTDWAPLKRIPPECSNCASVQARAE